MGQNEAVSLFKSGDSGAKHRHFTGHGFPRVVDTDNGPHFWLCTYSEECSQAEVSMDWYCCYDLSHRHDIQPLVTVTSAVFPHRVTGPSCLHKVHCSYVQRRLHLRHLYFLLGPRFLERPCAQIQFLTFFNMFSSYLKFTISYILNLDVTPSSSFMWYLLRLFSDYLNPNVLNCRFSEIF